MTGKKLTLWIGIITLVGLLIYFVPYLILYFLAQDAVSSLQKYEDMAGAKSEYTIKITGKRWHWHYEYVRDMQTNKPLAAFHSIGPDKYKRVTAQDNLSATAISRELKARLHPLVVPVNTQITLLFKSDDIVHQFKVKSLGIVKDVAPGIVSTEYLKIKRPGLYTGVCGMTENPAHKHMLIAIKVVSRREFDSWLAHQRKLSKSTSSAVQSPGKKLYWSYCAACHKHDGSGFPPVFPPLKGSKLANDAAGVKHIRLLINGSPTMPKFSQFSDAELTAIINYVHSAWGNKGKQIKEIDVANVRELKKP